MLTLAETEPLLPFSTMLLRLGLALLFGAAVGLDRQVHHKPAGLRTLMLVCLGACTFTLLPMVYRNPDGQGMTPADASRVIQGIVGGIGFLGAGVIMHAGTHTAGITTAAAIWLTAGVGIAVGAGELRLGIASGVGALLTLSIVGRIEAACFKDAAGDGPSDAAPTKSG